MNTKNLNLTELKKILNETKHLEKIVWADCKCRAGIELDGIVVYGSYQNSFSNSTKEFLNFVVEKFGFELANSETRYETVSCIYTEYFCNCEKNEQEKDDDGTCKNCGYEIEPHKSGIHYSRISQNDLKNMLRQFIKKSK